MYVHSIPNNNDNQDIVSMGCNAALMAKRVIDNSFEVLSIQLMTILQAVDYLDCPSRLAASTRALYNDVRQLFPKFVEDTPKYKDIEKVRNYLEATDPAFSFKALAAS
jgi:histidine ammonia-lyase